jgi:hypothetical protein
MLMWTTVQFGNQSSLIVRNEDAEDSKYAIDLLLRD